MIVSASFSKPAKCVEQVLGRPYLRVKIRAANTAAGARYFVELFTKTQVFHEQKSEQELNNFIEQNAGVTFKNCVIRTESEEITVLANKKGEVTRLTKKLSKNEPTSAINWNKQKKYCIPEGQPVPFMILLGIMSPDGKVVRSKYDKFRQINRFLEFIDDVLPTVQKSVGSRAVRIADFGCGKSYLTFAVHYFLTEVRHVPVQITGLDLKKDVIAYCSDLAVRLGIKDLRFCTGDIAGFAFDEPPDIVITLHACDTATDYALEYAVKNGCTAILSVPCCQHEVNAQLTSTLREWKTEERGSENTTKDAFMPLLKYGIIKERFASLVTDALRAELLEKSGYSVQLLEFIDMEHTPKNILIRAVKKSGVLQKTAEQSTCSQKNAFAKDSTLCRALQIRPTLYELL